MASAFFFFFQYVAVHPFSGIGATENHLLIMRRITRNVDRFLGKLIGRLTAFIGKLSDGRPERGECNASESKVIGQRPKTEAWQQRCCKAYRLALGVPYHTSTLGTYREANILPLDDYRKLTTAKYVLRSATITNSQSEESIIRSDTDFPKRAHSISSLETIATYTADYFNGTKINPDSISKRPFISSMPRWEQEKANFDINYTNLKKSDNINILAIDVKSHIQNNYPNHLKIYTDGSLLDNNKGGAAFIIPGLKIEKSFHIGENKSIFTAELVAITMALNYLTLSLPTSHILTPSLPDSPVLPHFCPPRQTSVHTTLPRLPVGKRGSVV